MPKCKSCGAEIRWAKTPAGKAIPIDEKPSPTGNITLKERPGVASMEPHRVGGVIEDHVAGTRAQPPIAVVLDAQGKAALPELQPSAEAPRYLSHFATCPNAGLHRKK